MILFDDLELQTFTDSGLLNNELKKVVHNQNILLEHIDLMSRLMDKYILSKRTC